MSNEFARKAETITMYATGEGLTEKPSASATQTGQISPDGTSSGVSGWGSGAVYGPGSKRADANYGAAREAVQQDRNLAREDAVHMQGMETALRGKYGNEFEANWRLVKQYAERLTPEEREKLEEWPENPADDFAPEFFEQVLGKARQAQGQLPTDPAAIEAELLKCQERMGRDRRGWMRDEPAQARYRDLIRLRDGAA